jgi:hypothetical protein
MLIPRLEMVSACMHIICRPNEGFDCDIPIYTLDARSEEDTSAALMFANKYNIEVSIKTTGHSYQGSSTSRDSLLIWMQKYPKDGKSTKDFADSCGETYDVVGINGGETWNDVLEAARVITIWSRELHGASNEEKLEYSKCSIFQTHYLVFIFRYHKNRTVSAAGGWLME